MGNGRCAVGSIAHSRMFGDMEIQIHSLEQEAYAAVLRAFKAQSDAITWVSGSCLLFTHSLNVLPICSKSYWYLVSGERKFNHRPQEGTESI